MVAYILGHFCFEQSMSFVCFFRQFLPVPYSRLPLTSFKVLPGSKTLPSAVIVSRTYASKSKTRSTAELVPGSQQLLTTEEARTEYKKTQTKMLSAVEWYRKEVAAVETRASGRITPALLAPVRVQTQGKHSELFGLEEVATVGVKDGSMLVVTVFDENVRWRIPSQSGS